MSQTHRLAAILAADVAGYSRLMGADEEGTLERLKALLRELLDPKFAEHKGRIVKTTGDGLLVEFASVVDAVRCAVTVQQAMPERNAGVAADDRIEWRIGINLGDVIVEGDDLYGDGVNIAARIEALADAGGVFVSNTVHDHVCDRLPFVFEDLGEQEVKNIARPVRVYRVRDVSPTKSPFPPSAGAAAPRQAVDRGSPVHEYEQRPGAEILCRRHRRGLRHRAVALSVAVRDRPQFVLHLRGPRGRWKQVGRRLGVRYVLEGSVRKAGGHVQIAAQLVEAETGKHVWAERYDRDLADISHCRTRSPRQ